MDKRGLSAVIISLILILLAIVVSGVLWVVISNVVQTGSEEISLEGFFLDLQIENVKVESNGDVAVTVKRGAGEADLEAINFIVSDGEDSVVVREDTTLQELGTSTFTITQAELSTIALVKEVSIAPIITEDGKEKTGRVATTETLSNKQTLEGLGAIGWWKFENNVNDEVGNNDGTTVGDISFLEGEYGQAVYIDGSLGNFVQVDDFSVGDEHTVLFWIYLPSTPTGSWERVMDIIGGGSDRSPGVFTRDNNHQRIHWRFENSTTTPISYANTGFDSVGPEGNGGMDFLVDKWYFVGVSKQEDVINFYADGENMATKSSISNPMIPGDTLRIGNPGVSRKMRMDELMIFDKTLTDDQIKAIYELGL